MTQLGPRIGIFDKPKNNLITLVYGSRIGALASFEPLSTMPWTLEPSGAHGTYGFDSGVCCRPDERAPSSGLESLVHPLLVEGDLLRCPVRPPGGMDGGLPTAVSSTARALDARGSRIKVCALRTRRSSKT